MKDLFFKTTLFFTIILGLSSCFEKTESRTDYIIIDLTVDDKVALEKSFEEAIQKYSRLLSSSSNVEKKKLLGLTIKVGFIDDRGANSNFEKLVEFPQKPGKKYRDINSAINSIADKKQAILSKIKSTEKFNSTLLLESVDSAAKNLHANDRLTVISDFNVVDSLRNFERGHAKDFTEPPLIYKDRGNVELIYINRAGQSLAKNKLVAAWWNKALGKAHSFDAELADYVESLSLANNKSAILEQEVVKSNVQVKQVSKLSNKVPNIIQEHWKSFLMYSIVKLKCNKSSFSKGRAILINKDSVGRVISIENENGEPLKCFEKFLDENSVISKVDRSKKSVIVTL